MLTATYTLVSLSVEQATIRVSLLSFQQYMHAQLRQQRRLSMAHIEYAGEWLARLYQFGYWRKIDQYLVPAIRQATPHADGLLDELGRLNRAALESVNLLQRRAMATIDGAGQIASHAKQLGAAIDHFCAALMARLEMEERELFALARRVIASEAWFAIAYQFLAHDARMEENRRGKARVLPFVPPAALAPAAAAVHAPAVAANSGAHEAALLARHRVA
ncbi:hypothetical protein [Janthinobacterium psychrotolerans]|uniref:Hemerythrin HHE cation binding domain-containing protein n=1 Tax=Janthinobacterium psychrotolerans TaxID=1747903 RepID=A0A1A7C2Y1_9BURK|nr:hypothetical protein [Janthinobacterium psychrotolerans]OBV38673.1 hypothetical protein ASR47_1006278 [Janthinobacterium psychrotolerans]